MAQFASAKPQAGFVVSTVSAALGAQTAGLSFFASIGLALSFVGVGITWWAVEQKGPSLYAYVMSIVVDILSLLADDAQILFGKPLTPIASDIVSVVSAGIDIGSVAGDSVKLE